MIEIHSTRLFPKDQGAAQYRLTGIAKRCDWIVLTDKAAPHTHVIKRSRGTPPKTIFLSLRGQRAALRFFVEKVLPQLTAPFTLVSGSEDTTIPNQIDARMEVFNAQALEDVATILNHVHLKAWVAENLDDASHTKLHPLPLGMVFNDEPYVRDLIAIPPPSPLSERPLKALCGHRVRPGDQWEARRKVSALAKHAWGDRCTVLETDLSEESFINLVSDHTFVICVEGGGIDPSPKAWLALLYGAIPIIKQSALDGAYGRLPVAFVDDWTDNALSIERLMRWKEDLSPFFDQPGLRRSVLKRLGVNYWWDYIVTRA